LVNKRVLKAASRRASDDGGDLEAWARKVLSREALKAEGAVLGPMNPDRELRKIILKALLKDGDLLRDSAGSVWKAEGPRGSIHLRAFGGEVVDPEVAPIQWPAWVWRF